MLVDEAHRTQYGQIAIDMRKLLPNASMFGFTGTPLELDDRNTPVAFGQEQGKDVAGHEIFERYLDRYSIADALRDRATVPIRWQARMTDCKVCGKALEEQFEKLFAHLSPGERNPLKTQEAKLDRILKHPERIAQIAADVAEHFKQHVQRNGFKAMLACHDKETCVLYKAALDTLLGPEVSLCIYSESPKEDSEPVKVHYLGDATRKKAIGVFKNLNEALNFDKNELGTIAYPFSQLRERFKLEVGLLSQMFKDIDRTGSYESLMKALTFLNQNEPARDKFEELYRNVRLLYE